MASVHRNMPRAVLPPQPFATGLSPQSLFRTPAQSG